MTKTTQTNASAATTAHNPTLAEMILIQASGDLSAEAFRKYMVTLAEREIANGPQLPSKLTIERGIEALDAIMDLCTSVECDFESAKNDPENDVIGYNPTDPIEDLIRGSLDNPDAVRRLVEIGLRLI